MLFRSTVIEKNGGVGGTWWENTYPGARVDVGNHFYCYSFEPDDQIIAIGSGGPYALAATRGMLQAGADHLSARELVENGLRIAADICIYTNTHLTVLELDATPSPVPSSL